MKKLLITLAFLLGLPGAALASNCSTYPYTLTNGQVADATQVMANFNSILSCANSSLAHNAANSDITSLTGLSTPLSIAQGGTGNTSGAVATATTLATGRTIGMTGDVVWTSPTFDGSANVTAAGAIQAGAVTTADIAANAVTAAKIANNTVDTGQLATTAVTPGSYTRANITVGADGRLTAASSNSSGSALSVVTSTPYTTVIGDANTILRYTAGDGSITIAANASVAYPVGTSLTIINDTASSHLNVAIASDTLYWWNGSSASTGTRAVAVRGSLEALKTTTTTWVVVNGNGIS